MDPPLQGFGTVANDSAFDDDSPCIVLLSEKKQLSGCEEEEGLIDSSCSHFMAGLNEEHGTGFEDSSSPSSMDVSAQKNEIDSSSSSDLDQISSQKQGSTALSATLFGQIWRLEPLRPEKKSMWRREMEWLLCVSDYIVELIPSSQTYTDGSELEVMISRPRSDLYVNLPALRKLDNMLLEILDSFEKMEFWYVDQGIQALEPDGKAISRQKEKWWLPVPRVPTGGLSDNTRKHLQHKRDSTNQILKAAMSINSVMLADMDVPQSFLEALPKNAKGCLGDLIYRYISSDQFSPECLLECLDLSTEHQALEIANRVEASIYIWQRKNNTKPRNTLSRSFSRSSWDMVKDLVADVEKRETLADRAQSLLFCLKNMFPALHQTTLDTSKIQYNKDVGKSILESYSRVLESLAFNIVARIDDLLYVDDLAKHSDKLMPYRTDFTTPSFSPSPLHSPAGAKKVLTDYLSVDSKGKHYASQVARSNSFSSRTREALQKMGFVGSNGGSVEVD